MEGDAVEAVGLIILVAIAFLLYSVMYGMNGFKFPSLSDLLSRVQAWMNDFLNGAIDKLTPNLGATGPVASGPVIYTGSNQGSDSVGSYDGESSYGPYVDAGVSNG
jgi:hypothetical protein